MLDPFLRRHAARATAPAAAWLERIQIRALALTLAAFVCAIAAMLDIGHRRYLWGLGFLLAAGLFDALDGPLARRRGATAFGAYLDTVLGLVAEAGIAFAFALAEPDRALAAMFLMLGLVARASAGTDGAKSELLLGCTLACLFPNWFSLIAYALGIAGFVEAGSRVAAHAVREP